MANTSRPHGFRPVKMRNGSPWNGRVVEMYFAAADATAVGIGDPVNFDGSASSSDGTPGCTLSPALGTAASSTVFGIVVGFRANPSDLNTTGLYRTASTARYALVCPVEDVIFEAQADGTLTSVASVVGKLFSITTDQTVSTTTGLSTAQIDASTVATTTTLPLMIIGGVNREDNDMTLTNAKWLVQFTYPQGKFAVTQVNMQ